jgi:hypothetical protein
MKIVILLKAWILFRFEALVEREWLQAGHPFNDRCAKSAFAVTKNRQESPVFLLFLDCVWQVRGIIHVYRADRGDNILSLDCVWQVRGVRISELPGRETKSTDFETLSRFPSFPIKIKNLPTSQNFSNKKFKIL